ncbi:MAG: hypothetical protein ABSH28_09055 [Acidobacteriota bacterium]
MQKATISRQEVPADGSDLARQTDAPVLLDADALIKLCEELEPLCAARNEAQRTLTLLEKDERKWARQVEKAETLAGRGAQHVDLDSFQRYFLMIRDQASQQARVVAEFNAKIDRCENLLTDVQVEVLQAKIKGLEAEGEERHKAWEDAAIRQLIGAKQNGEMTKVVEALQACKREANRVNKAIETASAVIRWEKTKAAIKAALPGLEELVAQQTKGFELAQEAGEGIAASNLHKRPARALRPRWTVCARNITMISLADSLRVTGRASRRKQSQLSIE